MQVGLDLAAFDQFRHTRQRLQNDLHVFVLVGSGGADPGGGPGDVGVRPVAQNGRIAGDYEQGMQVVAPIARLLQIGFDHLHGGGLVVHNHNAGI